MSVAIQSDKVWIAASSFDSESEHPYSIRLISVPTNADSPAQNVATKSLPELTGEPIPALTATMVTSSTLSEPELWFDADYYKSTDYISRRSSDGSYKQWAVAEPLVSRNGLLSSVFNAGNRNFILSSSFGYLDEQNFVSISDSAQWASCSSRSCYFLAQVGKVFVITSVDIESLSAAPVTRYVTGDDGRFLAECQLANAKVLVHESGYYPLPETSTSGNEFQKFGISLNRFGDYDFACGNGQGLVIDVDRRVHFFDLQTSELRTTEIVLSRPTKYERKEWPGRPIAATFDGTSVWYVASSYAISSQRTEGCDTPITYGCKNDVNVYGLRLWAINKDGTVLWKKRLK